MESPNTNPPAQTIPVIPPTPLPRRKHVGRWLTLFAVVLLVGAVSALMIFRSDESANVQAAAAATVTITASELEPQTIKVKKGQGVTWVNKASQARHVMADPYPTGESFESLNSVEPLAEGDSYTAIFEKSGTYTYHDQLDPAGIKGTVIVE